MKKTIYNIAFALLTIGGMVSCTDLDKEVDLSLSEEQVFSKFENTRGFLAVIYTYLPDAFFGYTDGQYLAASRDCMTDNATSYWSVHRYHSIQSDGYSAKNHWFAIRYWGEDWAAIRMCNQFLKNAREDVVGNLDTGDDDANLYTRYCAEARLLRAIFYMDLASWFGGVPIVAEDANGQPVLFEPGDINTMNLPRKTAAEVFQFVADECDAIKDELPFRYADENSNWGRVNGAAAYAIKSRALLYKASPLNNTENNVSWWEDAADAAIDFITKNSTQGNSYRLYSTGTPDEDYYNCFISLPHLNDEYILSRSEWVNSREIEIYLTPDGFSGSVTSVGRTNPTQNLVDAYETINGLPIDKDPTYNENAPYDNRDPRLEQTIIHHGTVWGDANEEEECVIDVSYPNGTHLGSLHGGTTTGYYTKKFLNNMSFKSPKAYTHGCPIIRYAEILLNAAEALNECGKTSEAYEYVDQVRARVGMPSWSDQGLNQEEFRERIQNERRVELAFEDHRFFDERRWMLFEGKTAQTETSLPRYQQVYNLYGVRVTADPLSFNYVHEQNHPTRVFISPKNYLFPIPDSETKMLNNLKQNPGWESSSSKKEEPVTVDE